MDVKLDGETVVDLRPVFGYLHRNHEKLAENMSYLSSMPFTDRLDYFNSMTNNWAYALAAEKLIEVEVPERAEYLRVIMAELTRLYDAPVLTKSLINMVIYTVAEWLSQVLRAARTYVDHCIGEECEVPGDGARAAAPPVPLRFDLGSVLRNGLLGLAFGPVVHYYYEFSDWVLPPDVVGNDECCEGLVFVAADARNNLLWTRPVGWFRWFASGDLCLLALLLALKELA